MSQIPPPPPPNWQQQQPYQQAPVPQQYGAPPYPSAAPAWQPGGFWIRFVAALIDSFILSVPMIVIISVFGAGIAAGIGKVESEDEQAAAAVAGLVAFLVIWPMFIIVSWLYEALMTSSERGATVGKRAVGLRIVNADGTRMSFGRATGRHFAKALITPLIPFAIGYIMAGFTDRKRALHDMIADTVVVKV
jgi:uncharacterized RDD family membrane protein YckC